MGEGTADIWAGIKGTDRPKGVDRLLEDISYGSSLGILTDLVNAGVTGRKGAVSRLVSNPTFAIGEEVFGAGTDLIHGKPAAAASTFGRRVAVPLAVSTVGKALGPVGGLTAGILTRAGSERLKKFMQEKQRE